MTTGWSELRGPAFPAPPPEESQQRPGAPAKPAKRIAFSLVSKVASMATKRRAQTCNLAQIPIPSYSVFMATINTDPKVHYEFFYAMMKERNTAVKNWDLIHSYYRDYQSRDKNVADVDSARRKRMKLDDPELKVPFYSYKPSAAVFGSEDDASNDMVQIFELTGRYGGN